MRARRLDEGQSTRGVDGVRSKRVGRVSKQLIVAVRSVEVIANDAELSGFWWEHGALVCRRGGDLAACEGGDGLCLVQTQTTSAVGGSPACDGVAELVDGIET